MPRRRQWWAYRAEPWLLAATVLVLSVLASFFPFSGDDWAWGCQVGLNRLENHFADYNGRWLGNLAVLALTRIGPLAALVVGLTLTGILFAMTVLARMRSVTGHLVALALLVTLPLAVWRQSVVWTSGFSNYALATLGLLIFFCTVQRDWTRQASPPIWWAVGAGVLGFMAALFIEHVTVLLVLASLLNVVLLVRNQRSVRVAALWLLGSLAGAALMFSNDRYRAALNGTSDYQKVNDSGLASMIREATGGVSQYLVAMNTALCVTLLVALAGLAYLQFQKQGRLRWQEWGAVAAMVLALASGAAVNASVTPPFIVGALTHWSWVPAILTFAALVLAGVYLVTDRARRLSLWVLLASVCVLAAPAVVMKPYGPRNFFPTSVLLAVVCLVLLREWLDGAGQANPRGLLSFSLAAVAGAVSILVLSGYFAVYYQIDRAADRRIAHIEQAVENGQERVRIKRLPYPAYVHQGTPRAKPKNVLRFNRFYGFPEQLKVKIVR